METTNIRTVAALAGAFALSACLSSGPASEPLPATTSTVPDTYSAPGSFEDLLASSTTETWLVPLEGTVATVADGSAPIAGAMVYDSASDQWVLNIAGKNHVLDYDPFAMDYWAFTSSSLIEFNPYDDPGVSQYGTFAYVFYADGSGVTEYYVHSGIKTAVMPATGTGIYAGVFEGLVNSDIGGDYVSGTADLTATFASGGGGITFDSSGGGVGTTYTLTGSATIAGNLFNGTVSGSYDDGSGFGTVTFAASEGVLSGAFYGPDQVTAAGEVAGVLRAESAAADPVWGEIAGGFWAQQTSYAAP